LSLHDRPDAVSWAQAETVIDILGCPHFVNTPKELQRAGFSTIGLDVSDDCLLVRKKSEKKKKKKKRVR